MKLELFQKILLSYLNIPYIYGGKNPLVGEDCSGLVCEFLKAFGLLKTNDEFSSQQLYNIFPQAQGKSPRTEGPGVPGALIFFGTGPTDVSHVAMFLDETFIIEAGHGTADTTTKEIAEQRGAYTRVRPYTYRTDMVGIIDMDFLFT